MKDFNILVGTIPILEKAGSTSFENKVCLLSFGGSEYEVEYCDISPL